MTALLQAGEPKDGSLNTPSTRQKAVILQQRGLLATQRTRDRAALFLGQHHAAERVVHGEVVVEGARVLRDGVEGAAEGAEGAAVDGVRVRDAVDLGTCRVHGVVDHVGGFVEEAHGAALDDFAGCVDEDEVGGFEVRPGDAEGVDPEGGGLDGVLVLLVDAGEVGEG